MTKLEIDRKIAANLHSLSLEERKSVLELCLSLKDKRKKQRIKKNSGSFGTALTAFLKKYENDPIDIDTSIFDSYRKSVVERDFRWED